MADTTGFASGLEEGLAANQARQLNALAIRERSAQADTADMQLQQAKRYQQFQQKRAQSQQNQLQTPQQGAPKIDPLSMMDQYVNKIANQASDEASNGFTVQADATMKKATEMMSHLSKARQEQAAAQENNIKSDLGKADYLGRQLEVVKSFSPELRPHYFELAKKDYENKFGQLPPQIANLPYSDKLLEGLQNATLSHKDKLHAQAEATRVQSESANRASEIQHRALLNKKVMADLDTTVSQQDVLKKTMGKDAVVGATGDEFLKTLPPSTAAMVKAISEGRESITSLSTKGGHREAILRMVTQYNPEYDRAASGVRKSFKSGKDSDNVTAINTAIGHIGTLGELGDALNNGNTKALNALLNRIGTETGNPNVNNFDIAKSSVGNELMRVFRQVGASESETKDWEEKFNSASSPAQLKGATKIAVELLNSRINALNDKWKRGTGSKEGFPDMLSEKSRHVLDKVEGKKIVGGGNKLPQGVSLSPGVHVDGKGNKIEVFSDGTYKEM